MIRLGLTGSIGMGKSTTASLFAEFGVPVYSADMQVHKLYGQRSVLILIEAAFPGVTRKGRVDRRLLSQYIRDRPQALAQLEAIVHPLLRSHEQEFLHQNQLKGEKLAVLDIPLLYETKAETRVDYIAVVSAPFNLQRQRVLARDNMDEEKLNLILARQLPDEEKRQHADFIINTGYGIEATRAMVRSLYQFFCKKL